MAGRSANGSASTRGPRPRSCGRPPSPPPPAGTSRPPRPRPPPAAAPPKWCSAAAPRSWTPWGDLRRPGPSGPGQHPRLGAAGRGARLLHRDQIEAAVAVPVGERESAPVVGPAQPGRGGLPQVAPETGGAVQDPDLGPLALRAGLLYVDQVGPLVA